MVRGRQWSGFEAVALQEAMRRSIREFAALLGVEATTITNWRSGLGSVTPRPRMQEILDTTLQLHATPDDRARFEQLVAEGEEVWRARHHRHRRQSETSARPPYDVVTWQPEHQADDVRRSDFLRGLLALSASALTDDLVAVATAPIDQHPPTKVGLDHADRVRGWASLFRSADDAGLRIGDGMVAQLRVAIDYLRVDMAPSVHTAMHAAVGTFFRVVGWANYDRGNHETARTNFYAGWQCAEQAKEWWLRATILTCLARQAIYLDQSDDALTLLGLAAVRSDQLSLLRRADVAAVQARAFGKLGNAIECVRAVHLAEELFAESRGEVHPDTEHEGFKSYYSETLLNGDTAHGLFDLSYHRNLEVDTTVTRLRTALSLSDEHARSRHLSLIRLAALQLRYGDVDEGLVLGGRAVEGATGTCSQRILDGLTLLHGTTHDDRVKTAPGIHELQRGITDVLQIAS